MLTRFSLRHPLQLLQMYRDYRRVKRDATRARGLLRSAFLIEDAFTCYSLSVWREYAAIPEFNVSVPVHVAVARNGFGRVRFSVGRGPEVWSTKWQLAAVSNNLNWAGFDLRSLLVSRGA